MGPPTMAVAKVLCVAAQAIREESAVARARARQTKLDVAITRMESKLLRDRLTQGKQHARLPLRNGSRAACGSR